MSDAERERMMSRGREVANEYDWLTIAKKQDRVYAEILSNRN